jgi:hypothetical protein
LAWNAERRKGSRGIEVLPGLANIERRRIARVARNEQFNATHRATTSPHAFRVHHSHVRASLSAATCATPDVDARLFYNNSSKSGTSAVPMSMIDSSLTNSMLQIQRGCQMHAPLLECTNSEVDLQISLAVKGDALIHGPCLVARPVGSEWRTRRPQYRVHPINYKGDQL